MFVSAHVVGKDQNNQMELHIVDDDITQGSIEGLVSLFYLWKAPKYFSTCCLNPHEKLSQAP